MTTKEPAWKKFLKLKTEVPISAPNIADSETTTLKRKREVESKSTKKSSLKKPTITEAEAAEKHAKANKQKKKAKTRVKKSKKDEADSKAAHQAALEYLSLYCSARQEWKFSKPRQNYILKHAYDDDILPDERFDSVLKYIDSLQGASRDRMADTAKGILARLDAGDEVKNTDEETETVTEAQASRARQILQTLQKPETKEDESSDRSTSSSDSEA